MKCDDCYYKQGYTLGRDECGSGSFFEYCGKGHWEDGGPRDEEEDKLFRSSPDPWKNCKDFKAN